MRSGRSAAARFAAVGAVVACAGLGWAESSSATQRFAAPTPIGAMNCSNAANACSIGTAVGTPAIAGDEVILATGDYAVASSLFLDFPYEVHGAVAQPRPRIVSTATTGVSINNPAAVLRGVQIEHTSNGGYGLGITSGLAEQVIVHTSNGQAGCGMGGGSIRDSVCRSTRAMSAGLAVQTDGADVLASARNVTAVGGNFGIAVESLPGPPPPVPFPEAILTATSVIADGTLADVGAFSDVPGSATANLNHSNYATTGGDVGAVTPAGSGTNQTAAPLFANAPAGDFHQLLGSPTIDMGAAGAGLGSGDIDGAARTQGSAPDIGADEYTPVAAPPAPIPAPTNTAAKKCKKKGKKRTASASKSCKKKKR